MAGATSRRLRQLELGLRADRDWDLSGVRSDVVRLQACLLAAHFGDYREGESLATAYARALGYGSVAEFKSDLYGHVAELTERHNAAFERLLLEHGLEPEAGRELEVCNVLLADVPQVLRERLGFRSTAELLPG